ncbi:MAG: nucleotide sugar dehydrogenase, partial [Methyloceanibacter sp.]
DLVRELGGFLDVSIFDPVADRDAALEEYGVTILSELPSEKFQAVVLAVKHRDVVGLGRNRLRDLLAPNGLIYDVTGVLAPGDSDAGI